MSVPKSESDLRGGALIKHGLLLISIFSLAFSA